MFVFEWFMNWLYGEIMKFIQDFFTNMASMGADIFDLAWIQAVIHFFYLFGWALYAVGLVVMMFEVGIGAQSGKSNLKEAGINSIKGFLAVGMFTTVPIELYKFTVTLQGTLGNAMSGLFGSTAFDSIDALAYSSLDLLTAVNPINLFFLIALGYCVIKVFFANIKRGGILLILISVGSLHMFSIPRGYNDGFIGWCKQIIALCITAFLQMTLLTAGLITFGSNMLLGLGIMLSANEVPRIADRFGLDTSAKFNIMSTYYATQAAINTTKAIMKAVKK
ncbi:MAG: hypothetical protein BWY15_01749 [Firmicutes bacterium ADurb.Bin193]|nr:MAG: hypothetical protein BWY15_01749 [Firmicutes bacterium ADurb.Bin193]